MFKRSIRFGEGSDSERRLILENSQPVIKLLGSRHQGSLFAGLGQFSECHLLSDFL